MIGTVAVVSVQEDLISLVQEHLAHHAVETLVTDSLGVCIRKAEQARLDAVILDITFDVLGRSLVKIRVLFPDLPILVIGTSATDPGCKSITTDKGDEFVSFEYLEQDPKTLYPALTTAVLRRQHRCSADGAREQ
jgi:hypothetical protein